MTWRALPDDCKAAEVWIEFVEDDVTKYFLLEGAVRSTKTYGSILAWCDYIGNKCPEGPVAMIGQTRDTLIRNVIVPMQDLLSPDAIQLSRGTSILMLFGRPIHLLGAPNMLAMKKIQGAGFVAVYCDEAETYPRDVWQMLGTRTDAQGMKIIATFNPGPPTHFLKKEYLDRLDKVNGRAWHFTLDDNPFLSEKVKNELIGQYSGLFYQRYILGKWVAAEGAIYDMFSEDRHVVHGALPSFSEIIVGVDYGTANPSAFVMLGRARDGPLAGKWIVAKEFYYSGRDDRQKTDGELSQDMKSFLGGLFPTAIMVDPSAASFKIQLKRDGFTHVRDADNRVVDGIRDVAHALATGQLYIHESCEHLLEEFPGYCWDPKAQEHGEDRPLKQNDHALDALRYAARRVFGKRFT
jgi:phage terminase, large subunit, PBSX family